MTVNLPLSLYPLAIKSYRDFSEFNRSRYFIESKVGSSAELVKFDLSTEKGSEEKEEAIAREKSADFERNKQAALRYIDRAYCKYRFQLIQAYF